MVQPQQQGADSSDAEISLEPGANQAGEAMMQRVYRRLDPSPGVIPLDSNRGLVARVLRLSTGRFPLTDAILRRWMPAAGDAWGYGPELLYLARDRGDASLAGDTALWGLPLAGQSRPDVPVVAGTPVMRADADLAATGLRARPAASCELPSGLSHRLAQPNEQPAVATRLAPAVARQAAASAGQGFAPARAGPPDTRPLPVAASEPSQATAIASSVSAAPIVMPRVVGSAPAGTIARRWPDRRAAAGAPPSPSWEMLQPLHEGAPGPAEAADPSAPALAAAPPAAAWDLVPAGANSSSRTVGAARPARAGSEPVPAVRAAARASPVIGEALPVAAPGMSHAGTDSSIQTDRLPQPATSAAQSSAMTGIASQPSAAVPAARPGLTGEAGRAVISQAVSRSAGRMTAAAKATARPGVVSIWGEPIVQRQQSERAFASPMASPGAPIHPLAEPAAAAPARTADAEPPILAAPIQARALTSPAAAGRAKSAAGSIPAVHARSPAAGDLSTATGTGIVVALAVAPEAGQPPGMADRPPIPVGRRTVPAPSGQAAQPRRIMSDNAGQRAADPPTAQAYRLPAANGPSGARTKLLAQSTLIVPSQESTQRRPDERAARSAERGTVAVTAARTAMARWPDAPASDAAAEDVGRSAAPANRLLRTAVLPMAAVHDTRTPAASAVAVVGSLPGVSRAPDQGLVAPAPPVVPGALLASSGQYPAAFAGAGAVSPVPGLPLAPVASRFVTPRPAGSGSSRGVETPLRARSVGLAAQGVIWREANGRASAPPAASDSTPSAPAAPARATVPEPGAPIQEMDLERVAHAVYHLLEQRLRLERETRGL